MKRLISILSLLALSSLTVGTPPAFSTPGALKKASICTSNGVTYGKHGDGHWHRAERANTRSGWIAVGSSLGHSSPCNGGGSTAPSSSSSAGSDCIGSISGDYKDSNWLVSLRCRNGRLNYAGRNRQSGASISFTGAGNQGGSDRHVYKWHNGNYTYQIAWQPADPNYVRLQVYSGGSEILNRLLSK